MKPFLSSCLRLLDYYRVDTLLRSLARDNKQPTVSSSRMIPGNQLSFRPLRRYDVDEDSSGDLRCCRSESVFGQEPRAHCQRAIQLSPAYTPGRRPLQPACARYVRSYISCAQLNAGISCRNTKSNRQVNM